MLVVVRGEYVIGSVWAMVAVRDVDVEVMVDLKKRRGVVVMYPNLTLAMANVAL